MAQDFLSYDLTPESRLLDHLMKDWHRTTDHEFDLQLDILSSGDSIPRNFQYDHLPKRYNNFDWSMATSGKAPEIEEQTTLQSTETGIHLSPGTVAGEHEAPVHEVAGNASEHATNDFDNPGYRIQDHTTENGSLEQRSSSGVSKLEEAAPNLMAPSKAHADPYAINGSSRMQRNPTAPILHSLNTWANSHSDGLAASNDSYDQMSSVHQKSPSHYHSTSTVTNGMYNQLRVAQTTDLGSPHYQHYPAHVPSGLRYSVSEQNGMDQGYNNYSVPYIEDLSFPFNPAMCKSEFGYNPSESSTNNNSHKKVLNSSSMRGVNVINNRNVSDHHLHYRNVETPYPMMDPTNTHFQLPSSYVCSNVHVPKILRSQSSVTLGGPRGNPLSSRLRSRSVTDQQTQQFNTGDEGNESDIPEMELLYATIEAARAAERPKVKTHHQKDETIPRTDATKQTMVRGLYECMYRVDKAQDNPGMIRQWMKLRQDNARVEQAAWRVLDMCLQIHVEGMPLVPNKASCQRYSKWIVRWTAICEGLTTQKTMCKHLLGADFSAQLVNDPETAATRVTNNRKVNASKKTLFDKGKNATRNVSGNKRRRASSVSPEDGGSIAEFGDEDAEGELDEDYGYPLERAGSNYRATPQASRTPRSASGPVRGFKYEHEDEDPDYADRRAKKPRRTTASARRVPANGSTRKQRLPHGSRSKYQCVRVGERETMVDVGDLKYEPTILAYGSPELQAKFNAIHYPNGPLSEPPGSHRSSRAAAPTTFRGLSNSDEVDVDESGSHYEGTEDENHQDVDSQHR
ncbi:MAG: hypothetical protein Q9197_004976 [Variospora fuerteventurae]